MSSSISLFSFSFNISRETSSTVRFKNTILDHIFYSPKELLKLSVPSLVYAVQNNMAFIALSNLDAAVYQVGYEFCVRSKHPLLPSICCYSFPRRLVKSMLSVVNTPHTTKTEMYHRYKTYLSIQEVMTTFWPDKEILSKPAIKTICSNGIQWMKSLHTDWRWIDWPTGVYCGSLPVPRNHPVLGPCMVLTHEDCTSYNNSGIQPTKGAADHLLHSHYSVCPVLVHNCGLAPPQNNTGTDSIK